MTPLHRSHEVDSQRRELCLPYSAQKVLTVSLTSLSSEAGERAYPLTPTTVADEAVLYATEHQQQHLAGPLPVLLTQITATGAESVALRLGTAFEFLEISRSAGPFVAPIVLYYAAAHATGALCRAFFDWRHDARHHGLAVSHRTPLDSTTLTIKSYGHFRRLVTASYLLCGGPSIFDDLITFAGKPTLFTGPGEALEHFKSAYRGTFPTTITLADLLGLDLGQQLESLRLVMGFRQWHRLPETLFLYDFLLLFLASSLARYDVLSWRTILDGRTNSYRTVFDAASSRFQQFGLAHVVNALYSPTPFWRPRASAGSPYADWEMARQMLT